MTATAMASRAVTGSFNCAWAAERVITPVMVSGLATKRIKGVSDGSEFACATVEADAADWLLSMENPIQASTSPPATIKASKDTPNRYNNWVLTRAVPTRITSMANPAFVASINCPPRERPTSHAQTSSHKSRDSPGTAPSRWPEAVLSTVFILVSGDRDQVAWPSPAALFLHGKIAGIPPRTNRAWELAGGVW